LICKIIKIAKFATFLAIYALSFLAIYGNINKEEKILIYLYIRGKILYVK
jgi:hypothetical protein